MPCFSETVSNYLTRLEQIALDYASTCAIEKKPDIKALMDYSENLSFLESQIGKSYNKTLQNSSSYNSYSDQNLNLTLAAKTKNLINQWSTGVNITFNMIDDLRNTLNTTIQYICVSQEYPVFFYSNLLKLSEFRRQIASLKIFNLVKQNQCLPSNWKYVTTIDYISGTNQIVVKYDPKSYHSTCDNRDNSFLISPVDLETGGYAFSFWIAEDFTLLSGDSNNVLTGVINNKVLYSYDLVKNNSFNVVHRVKVMDEVVEVVSNSTCSEWVFFMISIQKDCDKYRMILSIRFPGSNSQASFTKTLKASTIENLLINYNTNNKFAKMFDVPRISRNFLYTFENEMMVMFAEKRPTQDFLAQCPIQPNPPICVYYDSNGNCAICPSDKFILNYKCYVICPDGYYGKNQQCVPCNEKCKQCTDSQVGQCTDCYNGTNLYNGNCQKCPEDTWPILASNGTMICNRYDVDCLKCISPNQCGNCKSKYLYNNTCILPCPIGTYKDDINKICIDCDKFCTSCTGINKCGGCKAGFFLKNEICVLDCGTNFFKNNLTQTCDYCLSNCDLCDDSKICRKCKTDFNLIQGKNGESDKCDGKCPIGTAPVNNICVGCRDSNCSSCPGVSICQNCTSPFLLKEGGCVTNCGEGYYTNSLGACIPCDDKNCRICDKDRCSYCYNPKLLSDDKNCLDVCLNGYVQTGPKCNVCKNPQKCRRCLANDTDICDLCYGDKNLFNGDCVDNCPTGYFVQDKVCKKCTEGCDMCKDAIGCQNCTSNYFAMDNSNGRKCFKNCPEGTAPTFVNNTNICIGCEDKYCAACSGSNPASCSKCKDDYKLYNLKCYDSCPLGSFLQANNTCESCKSGCSKCDGKYDCKKCYLPLNLYQDNCLTSCPDNTISKDGLCISCTNNSCKKCSITNLDICTECPIGKFLYNNNCISTCPSDTYSVNQVCIDCVRPCNSCFSAKNCTSCITNFTLSPNNTCGDNCDEGFANVNGICKKCIDNGCSKCNANMLRECFKCNSTTYLSNGDCLKVCPERYFAINNVCESCPSYCLKCKDSSSCDVCENGKFLLNKKECVAYCPNGFIENSKECVQCNPTSLCNKCSPDRLDRCTKCPDSLVLQDANCKPKCSDGSYKNQNNECISNLNI